MNQGLQHYEYHGGDKAKAYEDLQVLVDAARAWLATLAGAEPFFLYLHVMNVHGPYLAPAEYRERFRSEGAEPFEFQCRLWTDIMHKARLSRREDVSESHVADLVARYAGAIAYTDEVLGEFYTELLRSGKLDDGLPLSLIHLPATILDLVGCLDPEHDRRFGDGETLAPVILRDAKWEDRPILAEVRRSQGGAWAVQQWPWHFIHIERDYAGRENVPLLFHLADDPSEATDRHGEEPKVARDLARNAVELRDALEQRGFRASTVTSRKT